MGLGESGECIRMKSAGICEHCVTKNNVRRNVMVSHQAEGKQLKGRFSVLNLGEF